MIERSELIATLSTFVPSEIATRLSYLTSIGLIILNGLNFLNQYASGIGALLAIFTFVINWVYRHRTLQMEKVKIQSGYKSE